MEVVGRGTLTAGTDPSRPWLDREVMAFGNTVISLDTAPPNASNTNIWLGLDWARRTEWTTFSTELVWAGQAGAAYRSREGNYFN